MRLTPVWAVLLCVALCHAKSLRKGSHMKREAGGDSPAALDAEGKLSEVTMKKMLSETNRYRLMHDATPLGNCPVCSEAAQKHADEIAASGVTKPDHTAKYGQIIFTSKDPEDISQGADYFGTLVPARIYNQIKNYDFVKDAFKENAADFSQLVWEGSEVVGFASKKGADGAVYVVFYFNPAGNNETTSFYENVNKVTGSGDIQQKVKCPDGWQVNGPNCYKMFEDEMAWPDAVDHCNVLKSSLFSGENTDEGAFIKTMLLGKSKPAWIGMSDMAAKGGFQFADGTPYTFSDWSRESQQTAIDLWNNKRESIKGQCIIASYEGWNYKDCNKKLPFICKMRPNGMTSYSLDLYFPGSSFTDDLADQTSQRYTTMKGVIEKAFNESYGKDIWFVGSTFYQFMPRDNGDVAASTLLKFAPDIRAPVDPISKLREYLRSQSDLKILAVRLIPGIGRVNSPQPQAGTCPSGCGGDCYPECQPGCCGQMNLNAPVQPSGYTSCPQFPNCGMQCQQSCSQQCCQSFPYQQIQQQPMMMMPQQQPGCGPQCTPQQCAPTCQPQCCQQQQMMPQQPPQQQCPQAGCRSSCAPQCSQQCCGQQQQQQQQMMMSQQQPMTMVGGCAAQMPGCPASCLPGCQKSCCQQAAQMQMARVNLGRRRSSVPKHGKISTVKKLSLSRKKNKKNKQKHHNKSKHH